MGKSIFGIQEEYMETIFELEQYLDDNPEAEGELPDEFMERLNINKDEAVQKLENYELVIRQFEAEQVALKERANQYYAKAKTKERTIKRMKDLMRMAIETFGSLNSDKSKTMVIRSSFINQQVRYMKPLIIANEDSVPQGYQNIDVSLKGNAVEVSKNINKIARFIKEKDAEFFEFYKANFIEVVDISRSIDKKALRKDIVDKEFEPTNDIYLSPKGTVYLMKPTVKKNK
ncbi:MAG: hypothetical protein COA82_03385 [Alkaliphilus sp.]|nr:MAG: hypothetical protein COA82_03385 [Alkaliphilus sp.]